MSAWSTLVACRRASAPATFGALALSAGLLVPFPALAVDFAPVPGLGLEYKNEVRVNASARVKVGNLPLADYTFLQSTVTVNNTENKKKNLVICVSGYSKRFDSKARYTEIDMTWNAAQKSLSCALSQNQEEDKRARIGQMGCRQVALEANQKGVVVAFVSGNNRTTIKSVANVLQVDRIGPVQDGLRSGAKIIAAGGAGAGGHPLLSPNMIGGKRERMSTAIKAFATRFVLSDDAALKLADDATSFNCNKCFGMGSTLGDPDATRTDFVLNLPSAAVAMQAQLKVQTQYDVLGEILLGAGRKTQVPFELVNERPQPVLVSVTPSLVELPPQCTVQLSLPLAQPVSIAAGDTTAAMLEFDCAAGLSPGATAHVALDAVDFGSADVLGSYHIRARNAEVCDVDANGRVDANDIELIMSYRNTPAQSLDDRFDVDADGTITVLDARACTLRCTSANCAR